MKFKRGDIVWADFRSGSGHVQRGRRPCLIVSTIDKNQILCMAGKVNNGKMSEVDKLIKRQLGFNEGGNKSE